MKNSSHLTVRDLAPLPPVLITGQDKSGIYDSEAISYAETLDGEICFIDLDTGDHYQVPEYMCTVVYEL